MNIIFFSTILLLLTSATPNYAMGYPFKKKYVRYYDTQSEILLSQENDQLYEGEWLPEESSSQQSIELETIHQEPKKPWNIINHAIILPDEINKEILLKLDLKTFFATLKTDKIRYSTCSEILIKRFLSEKKYQKGLLKRIPPHLNTFPIETSTEILDFRMLLMTAAKAGCTEDFHILLNSPLISNNISDDTVELLFITAIESERVGIIKQLIAYNRREEKVSAEKIKDYLNDSEHRGIRKLGKQNKKKKLYRLIQIFYPYY